MSEQIVDFIRQKFDSKPFSISVDETTDISVDQQLAFCVRFLGDDFKIHERFLGFYEASKSLFQ